MPHQADTGCAQSMYHLVEVIFVAGTMTAWRRTALGQKTCSQQVVAGLVSGEGCAQSCRTYFQVEGLPATGCECPLDKKFVLPKVLQTGIVRHLARARDQTQCGLCMEGGSGVRKGSCLDRKIFRYIEDDRADAIKSVLMPIWDCRVKLDQRKTDYPQNKSQWDPRTRWAG